VLPVTAELAKGAGAAGDLAHRVEAAIKSQLGASAKVTLLPAGSLPRTEGKTKRVIRGYQ